jgi:hypothetical protein
MRSQHTRIGANQATLQTTNRKLGKQLVDVQSEKWTLDGGAFAVTATSAALQSHVEELEKQLKLKAE